MALSAPDGGPLIDQPLVERLCTELVTPPARFLVSTANDRVFVEVAAPVDGVGGGCLDRNSQTNGPGFFAIDGRTGDIWGAYGDQCGGCGAIGAGWVCSDAVEVTVSGTEDFEELLGGLLEDVTVEASRRADAAGPTVAQAADRVLDALADVETVDDLTRFPGDPDGDGGVYYDRDSGELGCWLPGLTVDDGRDVTWSVTVRSDADLAAARAAAARLAPAADPHAPPAALADYPDPAVRRAVALHRRTPPDTLTVLASDAAPDVRAAAAANPKLPAAGRSAAGLLAD